VSCALLALALPTLGGGFTANHQFQANNDDVVVLEMGEDLLSLPIDDLLANDPPATGIVAVSQPTHGTATDNSNSVIYSAQPSLIPNGFDSFRYTLANANLDQGSVYVLPETYSRILHIDPIDSPIFNDDENWYISGDPGAASANDQNPIDGPYDLLLEGGTEPLWLISVKAKGGGTTTGSKTGFETGPGGNGTMPQDQFVMAAAIDSHGDPAWELVVENTIDGMTIQACSRDGFGGILSTDPVPFLRGIESERVLLYWWAASAPGLADGRMALFINNRLVAAKTGIGWNGRNLVQYVYGIGDSWLMPPSTPLDHTGTSMRLDNLGIWSEVKMPGHLPAFADGVETGDLAAWDQVTDVGSWISVTQDAALSGTWGVEVRPNLNGGSATLAAALPTSPEHLRVRFLLDARELTGNAPSPMIVLSGMNRADKRAQLQVRLITGQTSAALSVRVWDQDLQQWVESAWLPVAATGPHQLEVKWWNNPRGDQSTGGFLVWLDGQLVTDKSFSTTATIDYVTWGLTAGNRQPQGRLLLDDLQLFW
jgi:hypothetical protein